VTATFADTVKMKQRRLMSNVAKPTMEQNLIELFNWVKLYQDSLQSKSQPLIKLSGFR
jgi:hypothetical protein